MAQGKETQFKHRIRPHLNKLGFFVKVQQVSLVGTPDFLGCIAGSFVALELKASESAKLRPMQEYNLKKIELAGGLGLVVYPENWQAVQKILEKLARGERSA